MNKNKLTIRNIGPLKDVVIDIAKYTGTKLAFVNEDDKVIFTLTTTDLEEDQKMVAANAAKTKRKKK